MQKLTLPSCVRPVPAPTKLTFQEALELMVVCAKQYKEGKISRADLLTAMEVLVAVTPKR